MKWPFLVERDRRLYLRCEDDEGVEHEEPLPSHYDVCPRCDGEGRHDHPAFSNGITSEEWGQWDADEREEYLSGAYDVPCSECGGRRVVRVVSDEELKARDPALFERLQRMLAEEADYQAAVAAERRAGA